MPGDLPCVTVCHVQTPVVVLAIPLAARLAGRSTVPLTRALVAQIFGVRHASMLMGLVFFGHQIGSFGGAWLGGVIFTRQGSYDLAWWISMGLAVMAAIACAPVNERPIARTAALAPSKARTPGPGMRPWRSRRFAPSPPPR